MKTKLCGKLIDHLTFELAVQKYDAKVMAWKFPNGNKGRSSDLCSVFNKTHISG